MNSTPPRIAFAEAARLSHAFVVNDFEWSPDGQTLAVATRGNAVILWNTIVWARRSELHEHESDVTAVAWSPSGSRLGSVSKDQTARIWDTSGNCLQTIRFGNRLNCLAWSDEANLSIASRDGAVFVVDLNSEKKHEVERMNSSATCCAWSRSGDRLAVGFKSGVLSLIFGEKVQRREFETAIQSLAWLADGTQLVIGTDDGRLHFLNPATLEVEFFLNSHTGCVRNIAVTNQERWLLTKSASGGGHVWQVGNWSKPIHAVKLSAHTGLIRGFGGHPTQPIIGGLRGRNRELVVWELPESRDQNFDVFLCHNSEDKKEVVAIGEQLKSRGIRPWLDQWHLRPGEPWVDALQKQIQEVGAAAVFVGESGFGPWQHQELNAFLQQFVARRCPVIPVILPSCESQPGLPPFLASMTWVNFRRQHPDPLNQLIWGITGENPMPHYD